MIFYCRTVEDYDRKRDLFLSKKKKKKEEKNRKKQRAQISRQQRARYVEDVEDNSDSIETWASDWNDKSKETRVQKANP